MVLRSLGYLKTTIIFMVMILASGCLETGPGQVQTTSTTISSSSSSGPASSTATSTIVAGYQNALSVKVLFKKSSFYNNDEPNPLGCAGDARAFYDPITSRQIPAAPNWIKNISVDITNSNAFNGPSRAVSCGLSGQSTPPPINCASFDDLQPTDGQNSRSVIIGGIGCQNNILTAPSPNPNNLPVCSVTTMTPLSDIWNLNVPSTTTGTTTLAEWSPQSVGIPNPIIWGAGDYDELHDLFYIFGGATPDNNGNLIFQKSVLKVRFSSDRSVSSTFPPMDLTNPNTISPTMSYAGWLMNWVLQYLPQNPPASVGSTFTYALKRDPTFKTWCNGNDNAVCPNQAQFARNINEEQDYFLLVGGMPIGGAAAPNPGYDGANHTKSGIFSHDIYMYKPHGFSDDSPAKAPANGDWNLLSPITTLALYSTMSVATISATGNATKPYQVTTNANPFTLWKGRAYHRTVYDPLMNRFYIYGGLINAVDGSNNPLPATVGAPSATTPIATSDLWIYDPPALGRRPTEACNTNQTPDELILGTAAYIKGNQGGVMGNFAGIPVSSNIGINENYLKDKLVFPPGGCLQNIKLTSVPPVRFEHSMAFDRNQKAVLVFGGCQTPNTIPDSSTALTTAIAGDPSGKCTSSTALLSTALLNDTWLYIPPVTTEVIPMNQYSVTNILSNIFNTDFWLQSLPLYAGNDPGNGLLTAPTVAQALGAWINLTPQTISATNSPAQRMSASISYDRAHHKFYLSGGYGCQDIKCQTVGTLNDLWEFTPPQIDTSCSPNSGTCSSIGSWVQLQANNPPSSQSTNQSQPFLRKGAIMAYAQPGFSYGDEFYTVTDNSCIGQGPIESADPSVSKQLVGAIYIDINRTAFNPNENLLIGLRFLPFDNNTRLPGWVDFDQILSTPVDDTDTSSNNDKALIRVQVYTNLLSTADQIQASVQPRYHEFLSGVPVLADTLMYIAGPTGQLTDQQILIPLATIPNANLIKIERLQGSVKFYEMTLSKF